SAARRWWAKVPRPLQAKLPATRSTARHRHRPANTKQAAVPADSSGAGAVLAEVYSPRRWHKSATLGAWAARQNRGPPLRQRDGPELRRPTKGARRHATKRAAGQRAGLGRSAPMPPRPTAFYAGR